MKKLAVLTAVVFLFGVAGFAAAEQGRGSDPSLEANGNELVGGGGTNANDGGTAVAVKDTLNGNTTLSNNTTDISKTVDVNKEVTINKTEDSFNKKTEDSFNTKVQGNGGQAANNGGTNVNQEAFFIENDLPGSHATTTTNATGSNPTTTTTLGAGAVNGSNSVSTTTGAVANGTNANTGAFYQGANAKNNSDNPSADDGAQQAIGGGSNTMVKSYAEEGSLSAINTTGAVTLDKSTHIDIKNVGVALQNTDLSGKVEDNKLIVGGPQATSITKAGEAKSIAANDGKAESDEAKTGSAFAASASKSKSGAAGAASFGYSKAYGNGAGALGGSKSESEATAVAVDAISLFGKADADANSDDSNALSANVAVAKDGDSKNVSKADADSGDSGSKSKADSKSGSAYSAAANFGKAKSGDATGGDATSAAVTAYTNFTTGNNRLSDISFNGIGQFNPNTGVNSLSQQSVNVNAVIGGNVAGK
jgi:hypothetical protein